MVLCNPDDNTGNDGLNKHVEQIRADAVAVAQQTASRVEDEKEPYKHKYEAAQQLQRAIDTLSSVESDAQKRDKSQLDLAIAELQVCRGVVLLDTDLLTDAGQAVETALQILSASQPDELRAQQILQQAHNALGRLCGMRGDYEAALTHLAAAEAAYKDILQHADGSHQSATTSTAGGSDVEANYTTTLFYLAQVAGHAGQKEKSAMYCAATLNRQLHAGEYQLNEWVQNCLQLAGFFVASHAFALAQYCLNAAQQVVANSKEQGRELDEDMAANVQLAWARLYMNILEASHKRFVENQDLELPYPDASHFPQQLRFTALDLPIDDLRWGEAGLPQSFDAAREVFNLALPKAKAALAFYQMDGWVTDHVHIQLDISNLYRCLAGFESDPHRKCVMHKSRAKGLEPLSGDLNPKHYEALCRSIDLELGHIYGTIMEVKAAAAWPAAKVAASAKSAVKYFAAYLRTYESKDGKLPERLDPEHEGMVLGAVFNLGHALNKAHPDIHGGEDTAAIEEAYRRLRAGCDYVKRNNVKAYEQEAGLAAELADLLMEKLRLERQKAAATGRRT